jgi:hypothetical protein
MATVTPTAPGTAVTPAAASGGGDTIVVGSNSKVILNVINGSGSPINVTLTSVKACDNGVLHDVVKACPAGQTTPILIAAKTVDTATGNVAVAYSAVTTVTVYAITV